MKEMQNLAQGVNWKSFWVNSSPAWSSGALNAKEVFDLPGHQ